MSTENSMRIILPDDAILNKYPLPIAHEYRQLLEAESWWDKCQQLKDVLDFSLRYCVLIAVSDYLGDSREEGDPEIDAWLVRELVRPNMDSLYNMLVRLMRFYQSRQEGLFMPELYQFCYGSDSTLETELEQVQGMIYGFAKRLGSGEVRKGHTDELQELYERYQPRVKALLHSLDFLQDYDLWNLYDVRPLNAIHQWRFTVLMGCDVQREGKQRTMAEHPPPPGRGVALWDGRNERVLMLHPFALFDECVECRRALHSSPEELFLYEETKEGEIVYVGLRESDLGLTHRKPTRDTADDICFVLRVEAWPPGWGRLAEQASVTRAVDWQMVKGLARTQSEGQLWRYRQEKYQDDVYVQRDMVEGNYEAFIQGDRNGFLVVGDSGTGKTNLLCHWVDRALRRDRDIVLFYNCAELQAEALNLGAVIADQLSHQDFGVLLDWLAQERERDGQLLLVLDAINEHQEPQALLESVWRDLLQKVPAGMYDWFKLIVSCRTEAWRRLERHFKGGGLFYQTADGLEARLLQFTSEELPTVYEKYRSTYNLETSFDQLAEATRRFITDPLMLRFVAESYKEQAVPPDPRTAEIFERYFEEKVGDRGNLAIDLLEREIVGRLVALMYTAKKDELSEKSLWADEEIGQEILGSQSVNSAYFRLLDKGVLTQIKVGRAVSGAAALFGGRSTESETRVRFTYDRFFEYLLAFYLIPADVTLERVKELSTEATQERFASLWGALKTRLIIYAETESEALASKGVLAVLAQEGQKREQSPEVILDEEFWLWRAAVSHEVRGLIVDTLVNYGTIQPKTVQSFLVNVLLQIGSESAGLVAVFAAYRMLLPSVFEVAYAHPSPIVREAAVQHTYFYWSRYREQGESFLSELAVKASSEVKRSVLREAWRRLKGDDISLDRLPLLAAFLNSTLLTAGYCLTEPMAARQFAQNIVDLYSSFGAAKGVVAAIVKRWAGDALIEAWRSGSLVNMETLAIFTNRPLGDIRRKEVKQFAPYMGSEPSPIGEITDKLFEWSQVKDGVVSLVLVGILTNRSIHEPHASLTLLRRMFYEGNEMSQYNVVRTMSSVLQRDLQPCPGYLEFFDEAVLDIFNGSETTVEIDGKEYGLGHLGWSLTFECQNREHGRIEFVDHLLDLPWEGNEIERLTHIINELGTVGINSFKMAAVKPYPVLETLSQWFHPGEEDPGDRGHLESALARALARIWRAYPAEVESFLEQEPEMMMRTYEAIEEEHQGGMANFGAQGMTAIVFMPAALPGLVKVVQKICDEITDAEQAARMIGAYFLDPDTMERLAAWSESS